MLVQDPLYFVILSFASLLGIALFQICHLICIVLNFYYFCHDIFPERHGCL